MRSALYPAAMGREPVDLNQLAAGGYLALIHADGNRVGQRYNDWRNQHEGTDPVAAEAHGEVFFHSMRVAVRASLIRALSETFIGEYTFRPYGVLMLGGDDLLLACRADKALEFSMSYARALREHRLADGGPLNVALGVAIAQVSYPIHRLHELAEDLASSAKRLHRSLPERGPDLGQSVIDWQVVTQSWFSGVAAARARDERITYTAGGKAETLLLTARPYQVLADVSCERPALEQLLDAVAALAGNEGVGAARSPLRALRGACERGRLAAEMAFARQPDEVRSTLGEPLWRALDEGLYLTHALDIIGVREIARLGNKKHDR